MKLFGKKDAVKAGQTPAEQADILVLGSGCAKCNSLEDAVRAAVAELGMDTSVGHVTDFSRIAAYGVMSTPALVVKGKVVSSGRVLTTEEAVSLIRTAWENQ